MRKLCLALAATLLLAGCSDESGAAETLQDAGYKQITTTGYVSFGCGKDDKVHTGFVATSPGGTRVEGIVCRGFGIFGKASTIRVTGRV